MEILIIVIIFLLILTLFSGEKIKKMLKSFELKIGYLNTKVNEITTTLNSTVLNNLELSNELINIVKNAMINIKLAPDSAGYAFITKYINDKVSHTMTAYKLAKQKISYIFDNAFKSIYLNKNELKQYFDDNDADKIIEEIVNINYSLYEQFKNSMQPFISMYYDNPDKLNENLKYNLIFHLKPNIERCISVLEAYFLELEKKPKQSNFIYFLDNNFFHEAIRHLNGLLSIENNLPEINRLKNSLIEYSANLQEIENTRLEVSPNEYSISINNLRTNLLTVYNNLLTWKSTQK